MKFASKFGLALLSTKREPKAAKIYTAHIYIASACSQQTIAA
jgi:hypothetical protein